MDFLRCENKMTGRDPLVLAEFRCNEDAPGCFSATKVGQLRLRQQTCDVVGEIRASLGKPRERR